MPRVKRGVTAHARHKKVLKRAEGMSGSRKELFKAANEAVMHSLAYQYRDRRVRKRDMRALWIARINAAARLNGMTYSTFTHGLKTAGVEIDRKVLADIAVKDAAQFSQLVDVARSAAPEGAPAEVS
ncbi:MAG: large subunit ribosomal protein [Chloroflexota bacterium]|jgi:large subunit ribosomal protein L20|nr:large subunit ribosomal protein [Chloroflexota bacterium]